jgi:hypothetical protein
VREHFRRRTEIFVVRLWAEYLEQSPPAWRGEIEHVGSKEVMHFRSLKEMIDWIRYRVKSSGGVPNERVC